MKLRQLRRRRHWQQLRVIVAVDVTIENTVPLAISDHMQKWIRHVKEGIDAHTSAHPIAVEDPTGVPLDTGSPLINLQIQYGSERKP